MRREAKTERRRRGDLGERAAARYLRLRFYRILERNWFFYRKEADIIARRGNTLVICEVKTRTRTPDEPSPFGTPSSAVDAAKQRNLILVARAYARRISWQGGIRMDIIDVYLSEDDKGRPHVRHIQHIKGAFTA